MARLVVLCLAACLTLLGCGDRRARPAVRQDPVAVRSLVDRSAVWVGDPVRYTLEVVCAPGFDIVEDDLGRDHLQLTGLEVRDARVDREVGGNGTVRYRASFDLVSYSVEDESLRIGGRALRYYQRRDDGSVATERPVGTTPIPREELVLRSALPESADLAIRSVKPPALLPAAVRALRPVGLTLVVLSLAIVGAAVAAPLLRQWRSLRKPPPVVRPTHDYTQALDDIRRTDASSGATALKQAFARLDHLLRDRLTDTGLDARSLTAEEIEVHTGSTADPATSGAIARVLKDCERVRYGGPRHAPSHDLLLQAVAHAEAALGGAGRDR